MAGRADREAADLVDACDFGGIRHLVDVGGYGVLVGAVLRATPGLTATLVERPAAVEPARARIAAAGLADRCTVVTGDFFAALPAGADAYVLSRVLHDWSDEEAARILATCRKVARLRCQISCRARAFSRGVRTAGVTMVPASRSCNRAAAWSADRRRRHRTGTHWSTNPSATTGSARRPC